MNTHISYKTAKALKEFCPGLPEPMGMMCYGHDGKLFKSVPPVILFPAYQLHDLVSKPFCEAISRGGRETWCARHIQELLNNEYYIGGLPAVEVELIKILGAK